MATGYCTVEDLRRALRKSDLPGDVGQDRQIAIDAITAQTEWLEKTTKKHWYEPGGVTEDEDDLIPTAPRSRDDEADIPTSSAFIAGEPAEPKTWQGSYTKVRLERRDAESVTQLLVAGADGYEDWTTEYSGGSWPDALGDDYYLRVNSDGWSELYLDTENLYDPEAEEYVLESFSNAVYVSFDYGEEGLPKTVRRAVAFRAGSELVDEAAIQIPDNARLTSVETKAQQMQDKAEELLEVHL